MKTRRVCWVCSITMWLICCRLVRSGGDRCHCRGYCSFTIHFRRALKKERKSFSCTCNSNVALFAFEFNTLCSDINIQQYLYIPVFCIWNVVEGWFCLSVKHIYFPSDSNDLFVIDTIHRVWRPREDGNNPAQHVHRQAGKHQRMLPRWRKIAIRMVEIVHLATKAPRGVGVEVELVQILSSTEK